MMILAGRVLPSKWSLSDWVFLAQWLHVAKGIAIVIKGAAEPMYSSNACGVLDHVRVQASVWHPACMPQPQGFAQDVGEALLWGL